MRQDDAGAPDDVRHGDAQRPALYFTVLGEPPLKMLRYQQQFDFFEPARVNDAIHFVNLADETLAGDLNEVLRRISAEVTSFNPSFVFVDSFRSVVASSERDGSAATPLQKFVQELGMLMTSWQATTFLIGEYFTEIDSNPVFTVADGLIWMRQSVQRNSMVRKLEVMKMRGQPTLPGLHSFRISASGITVFAPAAVAVGKEVDRLHVTATPRANTGILELDEMLGGGLPRGYSLLVAGPSGSGKSILASAFLAEGVRRRRGRRDRVVRATPEQGTQSDPGRVGPAGTGRRRGQPRDRPLHRRDRDAHCHGDQST